MSVASGGASCRRHNSVLFLGGDSRGYRESIVLSVDSSNAEGRTIQVDTGEAVAHTMKLKRLVDRNGHHCTEEEAKWWSTHSFRLVDGTYNAPMRTSAFKSCSRRAIEAAFASVMGTNTHEREDVAKNQSPGSLLSSQRERLESNVVVIDVEADEVVEAASATSTANSQPADGIDSKAPGQGGDESEETSSKPPTDVYLAAMSEYLKSIPTRWERAKIRHQLKKRAGHGMLHGPASDAIRGSAGLRGAACKYTMPSHWWRKKLRQCYAFQELKHAYVHCISADLSLKSPVLLLIPLRRKYRGLATCSTSRSAKCLTELSL
ncbi:unnamed protein product [Phytophthora fragariaefolia]|uniref:Unnamed protein product n=1 Tax=Phytophthora fragariaefolia TaxID=1490495 RepID=A0A9W6Y9A2_9STRA|nr:unnamed protein product [Phytophthora fragariaefolia]